MSQFARRQMEQSGWTQGKGLGKNENGMAEALKVKIKADNAGIGHDPAEQFTFHWWEHVFAKSAENISVVESGDGVKVSTKGSTELASTKKRRKIANKKMLYGNFVKSGTLQNGKLSKDETGSSSCEDSSDSDSSGKTKPRILSDEELLAACGGRTAHKGARHGVNLGGKLARLQQQEDMGNDPSPGPRKRKKKKASSKDNSKQETNNMKKISEMQSDSTHETNNVLEKFQKKKQRGFRAVEENNAVVQKLKKAKKEKRLKPQTDVEIATNGCSFNEEDSVPPVSVKRKKRKNVV